jgi:hypothetical protein
MLGQGGGTFGIVDVGDRNQTHARYLSRGPCVCWPDAS